MSLSFINPLMIILYGSQTGNSIHVSQLIQNILINGYNKKTLYNISHEECKDQLSIEMDSFDFERIFEIQTIIFVCSTHGNGTEPFNMSKFWKTVKNLPPGIFKHLKFAVFGLGDSSYKSYNYCSKKLYNCLVKLGGTPLIRRGCGDNQDKKGFLTDFEVWISDLYPLLKNEQIEDARKYMINCHAGYQSTVIENKYLTPYDYDNPIIELCLDIPDIKEYNVGDYLAIYPKNYNTNDFMNYNNLDVNFYNILETVYDFNSIPQAFFFLKLYLYVFNLPNISDEIHNKIKEIYDSYDLYYEYILEPRRTIFEVLIDFKIKISFEFIVQNVPKICPRYFTLTKKDNLYFITVSLVSFKTKLKEKRKGLCSEYIKSLKKFCNINVNIVSNKLKMNNNKLLFICTGTGITLPRSVIHNLQYKEIIIYYGFRYKNKDMLYKEEFCKNNVKFFPVSSREDKKYVQDFFKQDFKLDINDWSIFVSGNSRLNNIIADTLFEMYSKKINFVTETW